MTRKEQQSERLHLSLNRYLTEGQGLCLLTDPIQTLWKIRRYVLSII